MKPQTLREAILLAVGSREPRDFCEFCIALSLLEYLPAKGAHHERQEWRMVMRTIRRLEEEGMLVVERERIEGRDMIQSMRLTENSAGFVCKMLDDERGLLNLQEVTAAEAEEFMSPSATRGPVHPNGDPDTIVPWPAPHKRRP